MDTGCCVNPDLKCYARDDTWATCKASCTPSFSTSCDLIGPGGKILPPEEEHIHADIEWTVGTWTSGYWDCCKPSCAWDSKGTTDFPLSSCHARTGHRLEDTNEPSICNGGTAVACSDDQPFRVNGNLSMGFAAAAVSGKHGLSGDENCGQCYELVFTDERHVDKATGDYWGGAHPDLLGKRMIIQVSNIGKDVTGNHSFDIQIPGAGQGLFYKGCASQFPEYEEDDFDCGERYGGCSHRKGCERLPPELRRGCEWRFEWFQWLAEGSQSNNPFVKFRRVRCPAQLVSVSGATPADDFDFPAASESANVRYA